MRRLLPPLISSLIAAAFTVGLAIADDEDRGDRGGGAGSGRTYAVGFWG